MIVLLDNTEILTIGFGFDHFLFLFFFVSLAAPKTAYGFILQQQQPSLGKIVWQLLTVSDVFYTPCLEVEALGLGSDCLLPCVYTLLLLFGIIDQR